MANHTLILIARAQDDYEEILRYTRTRWGDAQADYYDNAINFALQTIAGDPHIGRSRHGFLVHSVEHHRIFYRVHKSTIYVLRILHERMDASRHLPQ